jgi:hypothetical protein
MCGGSCENANAFCRGLGKSFETPCSLIVIEVIQMTATLVNKFVKSFVRRPTPPPAKDTALQLVTVPALEPTPAKTPSAESSKYYVRGKQLALATRALKVDPLIVKALEEQVIADAVDETLPRFDRTNVTDQRQLAELEALDGELETVKYQCEIAEAEARKREDDLAKCGGVRKYPAAAPLFRWIATAAITLSVAPSIYGFFGGLFPLLKWILAVGFGGAISLLIVSTILPDDRPEPEEEAK